MSTVLKRLIKAVEAGLKKPNTVLFISLAIVATVAVIAALTIYFSDAKIAMPILVVAPGTKPFWKV